MSQDADLASYLLLLRFGPCQDPTRATPVLNYASIARVVQLSLESVRRLIMTALRNFHSKDATLAGPRRKLSQHHVDYLCSHQTLTAWAHLSLQQRAVLFHRQFPELRVSASLLQRTYR